MNPTNRPILPAAPGTALPASTEDRHDWFSARAALITTTLCVAVFCLRVLARFSAFCVWDDAYMFTRYAENLLHGDFLAWNPGGPPVLGLTAPLYLILVAPLHYLVPASPGLAVWGASAIATGCFLVGLRFLLIRHGAGDPSTRRFGAVLVLFLLTVTSPELAALATSGMDTTFGLFWITATLLLALRLGATSGKAFARALGVVTALTFWARPDGVLFPLLVLGSLVAPPGKQPLRARAAIALAACLCAGATAAGLVYLVSGSAVPLPLMAKTPGFYGPAFEEHYRFAAAGYFLSFAQAFWPLLLLVAMRLRARGARAIAADLGERALTLASAIFVAYHLTTVVPIMGMASRFFFPCLPALAVLAVRTIPWVDGKLQERLEWLRDPIARTRVGLAIAGLIALTSAAHGVDSAAVLIRTLGRPEFARFTPDEHYAAARHTWVGLDELRILPDNLVLASTEIGLPGVLLPRKAIVDLAGLQEPLLTRDGMPAPEVIRRRRPDWVYLPHPHYRELAATIFNDDDFRQNYEVFSSEHFGAFMGVAIRRESRYYEEMLRIARSHEVPDALWIRSGPMRLHGR